MKKNVFNNLQKAGQHSLEWEHVEKKSTENNVQNFRFLFHAACLNPFIPVTDLSFIADGLKAFFRNRKPGEITQNNQQQNNKTVTCSNIK
ncbi:hypothetical protein FW781_00570 (plasmid) [Chryseobacterium panacisoli]|uniref:Uncharacterized protein n=1 Tax=Chryseobacterium panacisoli TaxID=1807141 RepID=A0A5D8ZU62_9FLAO|nr:hypothetical protein [Chryseobacterium panacisoli]TZF98458.1 hypothetical protein FW781_00570 [Chryseobacterium panacisoli]